MMIPRLRTLIAILILCLAAEALGRVMGFEEYRAVEELLSRLHTRMPAMSLLGRPLDGATKPTIIPDKAGAGGATA